VVRCIGDMKRLLQNLTTGRWHLRRLMSQTGAAVITEAVTRAEQTTSAQIKVVIEAALDLGPLCRGQTARERALEVFGLERVWDTSANNGILLYLLVSERDAEIVADRGLNGLVTPEQWSNLCDELTRGIPKDGFVPTIVRAVEQIGTLASKVCPSSRHDNELSDQVLVR
jgi:uncharacterized membrane protein